nr:tetratricopeptide repeat protein [Acidobacteriota bacterium]
QLNIGNAYYNAGKFQEAIAAFQRVTTDYPNTDSVPQAYYKMGLTYMQMKQPDLARKALQVVLNEHPNSREQVLAKQALDRISRP